MNEGMNKKWERPKSKTHSNKRMNDIYKWLTNSVLPYLKDVIIRIQQEQKHIIIHVNPLLFKLPVIISSHMCQVLLAEPNRVTQEAEPTSCV